MLWLSLLICAAFADYPGQLDYSVRAVGRSYSLGFLTEGTAGYSQPVWGDPASGPMFGYVRPSAAFGTSGLTNVARADIELYPVSILGVRLGRSWTHRANKLPGFDCKSMRCDGWVGESLVALRALAGLGNWFGAFDYEWRFFDRSEDSRPLAESFLGFALSPAGDQTRTGRGTVGYRLSPRWSVGLQGARSFALSSSGRGAMDVAFVRSQGSVWTWLVGTGRFAGTPVFGSQFVGVFMVQWVGLTKLGL